MSPGWIDDKSRTPEDIRHCILEPDLFVVIEGTSWPFSWHDISQVHFSSRSMFNLCSSRGSHLPRSGKDTYGTLGSDAACPRKVSANSGIFRPEIACILID